MKTVTITDPADFHARLADAFPGYHPMVHFGCSYGDKALWSFTLWQGAHCVQSHHQDFSAAFAELSEKVAAEKPEARLASQAAALGMKLVPA